MKVIIPLLLLISMSPANATTLTEDNTQQLVEFVSVAVMIFSFMFGAQFGHTR